VFATADGQDDLIEMPLAAPARCPAAQPGGDLGAKLPSLLARRLVAYRDAARRQQVLNHPQAERKGKYSHTAVAMISAG
jgi:hypothetical protein